MRITLACLLVAVGLSLWLPAFPSEAAAESAGADWSLEDVFPPMNTTPPPKDVIEEQRKEQQREEREAEELRQKQELLRKFPRRTAPTAGPRGQPGDVAPEGSAESARQGTGALTKEGDFVSLNFDYADIGMVIQTVAELLKINYILAPGVSGKVTIQTSGRIAVSELLFVLEKMLEVNNLSMVKSGDFYKIIPAGSAARESLGTLEAGREPAGPGMVIKVFQLSQIAPSEVVRIFGALKSPQGVFIPHDPGNLLFVLETPERLAMFGDLIAAVDVDAYRNVQVEMYPVKHSQADELARDLSQVLAAVATGSGRGAAKFKLVPVKSLNTLILVSAEPGLGALMKRWVNDLDQPAAAEAEKVFVHYLDHAGADNVAAVLRELYSRKGDTGGGPDGWRRVGGRHGRRRRKGRPGARGRASGDDRRWRRGQRQGEGGVGQGQQRGHHPDGPLELSGRPRDDQDAGQAAPSRSSSR